MSPLTTTIYTHPCDQEMWQGVRKLSCYASFQHR